MNTPLQIGPFALAGPVLLAPMSGVSDLPFRRAAARAGAELVISEMVASAELVRSRPEAVRRAENDPLIRPFVIQLAGAEARWLAEGARLAEAAGADIIDINMGCPSRQVTGQACGSALMRDIDRAASLIGAVIAATAKPVTVKMRLGWDRGSMNAPELACRAERLGVAAVTVHGRTRNEFFAGAADWSAVRAVKQAVTIPVIVNGDVGNLAAARRALELSGADGVMIGRAAIGRPWLPRAIAEALRSGADAIQAPASGVQREIALAHYSDIIGVYGEALGIRVARKHIAAYVDAAPIQLPAPTRRALRAEICQLTCVAEVRDRLASLFDAAPAFPRDERPPTAALAQHLC